MRDPARIHPFLMKLEEYWSKVPDWRFGQLMCNILESDEASGTAHPFYVEDDEMLKIFEKFLQNYLK